MYCMVGRPWTDLPYYIKYLVWWMHNSQTFSLATAEYSSGVHITYIGPPHNAELPMIVQSPYHMFVYSTSPNQGYLHCFVYLYLYLIACDGATDSACCSSFHCCADRLQLVSSLCRSLRELKPSTLERELAGLMQTMQEALAHYPQVCCQL